AGQDGAGDGVESPDGTGLGADEDGLHPAGQGGDDGGGHELPAVDDDVLPEGVDPAGGGVPGVGVEPAVGGGGQDLVRAGAVEVGEDRGGGLTGARVVPGAEVARQADVGQQGGGGEVDPFFQSLQVGPDGGLGLLARQRPPHRV